MGETSACSFTFACVAGVRSSEFSSILLPFSFTTIFLWIPASFASFGRYFYASRFWVQDRVDRVRQPFFLLSLFIKIGGVEPALKSGFQGRPLPIDQ